MLSFVLIVNNGIMRLVIECETAALTWFEEWFLYFEYMWGRTLSREVDAAVKYKVSKKMI
jgi:hypothetical protein